MKGRIVPLPYAITWILISNICVCSLAYHLLGRHKRFVFEKYASPKFHITSIIQNCPQRDTLSTSMLSQMLDLSKDRPVNLFRFDCEEAKRNLLEYPMIQKAQIKTIKPSSIYVEYRLRIPVAFIGDFYNMAIDEEGEIFPYTPFYSPKVLPEIYCGQEVFHEDSILLRKSIDKTFWKETLQIIKTFESFTPKYSIQLQKIDFSKMHEKSLGMREIIVEIKQIPSRVNARPFLHCLRLSPHQMEQSLGNYLVLLDKLKGQEIEMASSAELMQELVIDLRIQDAAIMTELK